MEWHPVTKDAVILEFLRSERHTLNIDIPALIDQPNIDSRAENALRLKHFAKIRKPLLERIPPDIHWYKVNTLTDADLPDLRVIGRSCFYNSHGINENELQIAASELSTILRRPPMNSQSPNWGIPILWAHKRTGPFTIIEGNHRLASYASQSYNSGLSIPVYVGLSNNSCFWHIYDAPNEAIYNC